MTRQPPSVRVIDTVGSLTATESAATQSAATESITALPDHPWDLHGTTWRGRVDDVDSLAGAVAAAMRGCSVEVECPDPQWRALLLDDCRRLGLQEELPRRAGETTEPDWASLLDALTDGLTVAESARRSAMSLRSAHRRLAQARAALAVGSTNEAVVAWQTRRSQ